jgi:hypothetical protein
LSYSECLAVNDMLGEGCQPVSTTVAALHRSRLPKHKKWRKVLTGVVCLVMDTGSQSYWIRVYDMQQKVLAFEQELYHTIQYKVVKPNFHTFSTPDGQVGLNFANREEAQYLGVAVTEIHDRQMESLKSLGWNQLNGRYDAYKVTKDFKTFIERAGARQMTFDAQTMNFILDFIEKNGKYDAVVHDNARATALKTNNKALTPPRRRGLGLPPPVPSHRSPVAGQPVPCELTPEGKQSALFNRPVPITPPPKPGVGGLALFDKMEQRREAKESEEALQTEGTHEKKVDFNKDTAAHDSYNYTPYKAERKPSRKASPAPLPPAPASGVATAQTGVAKRGSKDSLVSQLSVQSNEEIQPDMDGEQYWEQYGDQYGEKSGEQYGEQSGEQYGEQNYDNLE